MPRAGLGGRSLRSPRRRRAAGPSLRRHSRAEGDIPKAIAVLEAGIAIAMQNGDAEVTQILPHDLERYQRAAAGEAWDLSR